jgi:signal transduction histidine kinase
MSSNAGSAVEPARVSRLSVRGHVVTLAVWLLMIAVFLLDILTPADNVSVCFAYVLPIFLSLFEEKPRYVVYATAASILSVAGSIIQPPTEANLIGFFSNRAIAVLTQWLAALLVRIQKHRLAEQEQRAEYQRRFVDILSHEVGTALTSVTGQAHRLTKLAEQITSDGVRERAGKIRKAAERIEAIVNRVKFASTLGDGTIPIANELINLQGMMLQLVDQINEEIRPSPITLELCPEPLFVAGDEALLRHVFENILMNSVKYSERDALIAVRVTAGESSGRVTIADHGSGISSQELTQVRSPYYRGANSRGIAGAGLGLYIVDRIVEAHRGQLVIESAAGWGTTVTIGLPRALQASAA